MTELDAGVLPALEALVDPATRGDPMSPLRWTTKSTAHLAGELTGQGHAVTARTVASLLAGAGYSLQGNAKTVEGRQHPDRDAQFRYINAQVDGVPGRRQPGDQRGRQEEGERRELQERRARNGRRPGSPSGSASTTSLTRSWARRCPTASTTWPRTPAGSTWAPTTTPPRSPCLDPLLVGQLGKAAYPDARRLLITADAGGSNGYRLRLWKTELAAFADEAGLGITVCHMPPGTTKWNKIEHRLFSTITMNWRGSPLTSHEVIVETIARPPPGPA